MKIVKRQFLIVFTYLSPEEALKPKLLIRKPSTMWVLTIKKIEFSVVFSSFSKK